MSGGTLRCSPAPPGAFFRPRAALACRLPRGAPSHSHLHLHLGPPSPLLTPATVVSSTSSSSWGRRWRCWGWTCAANGPRIGSCPRCVPTGRCCHWASTVAAAGCGAPACVCRACGQCAATLPGSESHRGGQLCSHTPPPHSQPCQPMPVQNGAACVMLRPVGNLRAAQPHGGGAARGPAAPGSALWHPAHLPKGRRGQRKGRARPGWLVLLSSCAARNLLLRAREPAAACRHRPPPAQIPGQKRCWGVSEG